MQTSENPYMEYDKHPEIGTIIGYRLPTVKSQPLLIHAQERGFLASSAHLCVRRSSSRKRSKVYTIREEVSR